MNDSTTKPPKPRRKLKPSPRALKRKAMRKLVRLDSSEPIIPQVRRVSV